MSHLPTFPTSATAVPFIPRTAVSVSLLADSLALILSVAGSVMVIPRENGLVRLYIQLGDLPPGQRIVGFCSVVA